jgi:CBS domain-containing protein
MEELMIPISEYATVSQDVTLKEAIEALKNAQKRFDKHQYIHRAVLVYNEANYIVGKVSQLDILRALEPKYDNILDTNFTRYGFSPKFMRTMLEQFELWESTPEQLSEKTGKIKVKDFMYTPSEGEFVKIKDSLDQAIHQLVMGHHQSLLVISGGKIVGILRLTDVFGEICRVIDS